MLETFAHAEHVVGDIADAAIKLDDIFVGCSHLEIDLAATGLAEQVLGMLDDFTRITSPLKRGIDADVIKPAAMAIVAGPDRGDDFFVQQSGEKKIGPDLELAGDVHV